MTPTRLLPLALLSLLPAFAQAVSCDGGGVLSVRTDNDVYGRANQDQGYTAGAVITWVSPNLDSLTDDTCLPAALRWIDRGFGWLQPDGAYRWTESQDVGGNAVEIGNRIERRRRNDPDLWAIELDVAHPERFTAETVGEG